MSVIQAGPSAPSNPHPEDFDEGLNSDTIQKYKSAAAIANEAMQAIIKEALPGKKIIDLCQMADDLINDRCSKLHSKSKMEKGIGFPPCVSVNTCAGHHSPLPEATDVLLEGDVIKIDLAVHLDGYIASGAQTVVVSGKNDVISGRQADVVSAAYYAAEAALRLLKPGKTNAEVTEVVQKVAAVFKCNPLEGVLSHKMSRFVIDGEKVIANKNDPDNQVDTFTFQEGEVYCLDIMMSTMDGKTREEEDRCTIYKRNSATNYSLKLKSARSVFGEIIRRFPAFPFAVRSLEDKRGRLGLLECINHDLLIPFPVLHEKDGGIVAQIKCTVLLTTTGTQKITDFFLPPVQSEFKIEDPDLKSLLAQSTSKPKSKPKKKKKAAQTSKEGEEVAEEEEAQGDE